MHIRDGRHHLWRRMHRSAHSRANWSHSSSLPSRHEASVPALIALTRSVRARAAGWHTRPAGSGASADAPRSLQGDYEVAAHRETMKLRPARAPRGSTRGPRAAGARVDPGGHPHVLGGRVVCWKGGAPRALHAPARVGALGAGGVVRAPECTPTEPLGSCGVCKACTLFGVPFRSSWSP